MPDIIHKAMKWVDHNRYVTLAGVMLAWLLVTAWGCESTTMFRGDSVNRTQLNAQATALQADFFAKLSRLESDAASVSALLAGSHADLDTQDARKAALMDFVGTFATDAVAGTINPLAAVPSVLGLAGMLFGVGSMGDKRRVDRVLVERRKSEAASNG